MYLRVASLAQVVEHVTLVLRVGSSSSTMGVEIALKNVLYLTTKMPNELPKEQSTLSFEEVQ